MKGTLRPEHKEEFVQSSKMMLNFLIYSTSTSGDDIIPNDTKGDQAFTLFDFCINLFYEGNTETEGFMQSSKMMLNFSFDSTSASGDDIHTHDTKK